MLFTTMLTGMAGLSYDRAVILQDRLPGDAIYDYYIYDGTFGRVTSQYKYNPATKGIDHVENGGIVYNLASNQYALKCNVFHIGFH